MNNRILRILTSAAALTVFDSAVCSERHQWEGFYASLHAGVDRSRARIDGFDDRINSLSNASVPGFGIIIVPAYRGSFAGTTLEQEDMVWGGQGGFAWQVDSWVFGAEGELSKGGDAGSRTVTLALPATFLEAPKTATLSRSAENRYSWSVRGRLGYAWDRMQVYGTGGVAGAKLRVSARGIYTNPGGNASPTTQVVNEPFTNITAGSEETDRTGWTIGLGGEWAVTERLSIGLEYRHTDLGSATYDLPTTYVGTPSPGSITAPPGAAIIDSTLIPHVAFGRTTIHHTDDTITLRLNVHFGR